MIFAVPCPREALVVWLSPHRRSDERRNGRADQLRPLTESDPNFQVLYGMCNDREPINSGYERALIVD